jgi:hypothetical protein
MSPNAVKMAGIWSQDAEAFGIADTKKSDISEELGVDLEEALERLSSQRESLRDGVFDARPRVECDPYCKFLSVCRFDPSKEGQVP